MATPTIASTASAQVTGGVSISVAKPTGTTSGDTLFIAIGGNELGSVSLPAGFSEISRLNLDTHRFAVCGIKTAGASEPSSYSPAITAYGFSGYSAVSAAILRITGADAESIVSLGTGSNTATVPNGANVPSSENIVLSFACGIDAGYGTVPSGWTEAVRVSSGNPFDGEKPNAVVQMGYKDFSAGSIGTHNWNQSFKMMLACAIPPAAVAATAAGNALLMVL